MARQGYNARMLVTLVDDSIPFNGSTLPTVRSAAPKGLCSLPPALVGAAMVRAFNRAPHSIGIENVSWISGKAASRRSPRS
jgi:hypothetical protein